MKLNDDRRKFIASVFMTGDELAKSTVTREQQAILDECQQWLDNGGDKGAEMPEELWKKFWDEFGVEIEAEHGTICAEKKA